MAAGAAAINCALLYTGRRFAPFAFYQACLNACTIIGALSLYHVMGVYGFAIGYTAGAWVQYGIVYFCARADLDTRNLPPSQVHWREILGRPLAVSLYAVSLALNIVFTRAWATHIGPGMAAALDYCMRGVGVPLAFLVSPISNSLLPEIARLRSPIALRPGVSPDRQNARSGGAGRGGGMRRGAGFAPSGHRDPVSTRQLHRGIHPLGLCRFPGHGAQLDWLEPAGIDRARAVRAGPPRAGVECGHSSRYWSTWR